MQVFTLEGLLSFRQHFGKELPVRLTLCSNSEGLVRLLGCISSALIYSVERAKLSREYFLGISPYLLSQRYT